MVESIVAIVCLLVVLPGMVLWFLDRRRRGDDSASPTPPPAELAQRAERMEQRITALEKLLDAEAPGWRTRDVE